MIRLRHSILTVSLVLSLFAGCTQVPGLGESAGSQNALPERSAYATKVDFLRARVEYYTTRWVQNNPDKPYYFVSAVPITEVTNGVWGMETGPVVVSGPGLFVTVDGSGNLIQIKEM